MASFKDANGKEWIVSLDAPKIRTVRQTLDIDLTSADGSAIEKLADDYALLVDVLWLLCRKQAGDSITDEQFGEALVGDPIGKAADALTEAVLDFFPSRRRTLIKAVSEKNRKIRELATAKAMDRLNDSELEKQILDLAEAQMDEQIKAALTRLQSATNLPASAESIPTA